MNVGFLSREQRVALEIKSLFVSYGFREYKLSGLEEYSLYSQNQSFLGVKDVAAFSAGGKLVALRPDVTLSVIKNAQTGDGTQKLFYDEKVYRKNAQGSFSELSQIGAEVIGEVDVACEAELITLMQKTLAAAGGNFILDISHVGITETLLDKMKLCGKDRATALGCLERKAAHDFTEFAARKGIDKENSEAFKTLITLPADLDGALAALNRLPEDTRIYVEEIEKVLKLVSTKNINIDFSAGGDAQYYNGLIFKGYVSGAPKAVLYGGRYDKLVEKFGKSAKALGFALYLGELSQYFYDTPYLPDAAVVYKNGSEGRALEIAEKLREGGLKVLLTRTLPENFSGKIIYAEGCDA